MLRATQSARASLGHKRSSRYTKRRSSAAAALKQERPALKSADVESVTGSILPDGFGISASELEALCELSQPEVGIPSDLADRLRTRMETGISGAEEDILARRAAFGDSAMPETKRTSFLDLVLDALNDFTLWVLLGAGVISFTLWYILDNAEGPGWIDGVAILSAVVVVVAVSATTNFQRDAQFSELAAAERDVKVRVRRGGRELSLSVNDLVVGDILLVESGDILPGDGVLLEGYDVRTDESHLTGEAGEKTKSVGGDPRVFSGSRVLSGFGLVALLAVGVNSQQGKIFEMTQGRGGGVDAADQTQSTSVLEEKLEELAEAIGKFGLVAATLTFGLQLTNSLLAQETGTSVLTLEYAREVTQYVVNAIAILVVAIPEGLPLAVTMALAFSMRRMLSDNNLVRHLYACETMATCTSICSDKTGTLTLNKMKVTGGWVAGVRLRSASALCSVDILDTDVIDIPHELTALNSRVLHGVKEGIVLNSTASLGTDAEGAMLESGNRTECALLRFACSMGAEVPQRRAEAQVLAVLPFSSERKRMSMAVRYGAEDTARGDAMSSLTLFCKGAAEVILDRCERQLCCDGTSQPLDAAQKAEIMQQCSGGGLRLVALAVRHLPEAALESSSSGAGEAGALDDSLEHDLTLVAVLGIQDELRPEVPVAVRQCQDAGITVRMLTGDNAATATSIAYDCGVLTRAFLPACDTLTSSDPVVLGERLTGGAEAP